VAIISFDQTWTKRDQLATQSRYSDLTGTNLVGTTSYGYDAAMRESNLQFKDGSANNISNFTYSYDPGSRLTAETLNGASTSYQYNADSELTQSGSLTYGYDATGNRNTTGYTTSTENQLTNDGTWTYTYDGEGSVTKKSKGSLLETWTYGYDNLNHLVWAEDRASDGGSLITRMDFKYDVFGDRIDQEVTANSTTTATHFAYDGDNAWADLSGTNVLQTRRLYLDAVDALFARISSGGTAAWYLTDRLGSLRDIANNTTGASIDHLDYDGYGNVTNETNTGNGDREKFTGREYDSVMKLQYNRGRYYDPAVGRWTSQDPIGFGAGDSNLYRYVDNNPTNAKDVSGLEEKAVIPVELPLPALYPDYSKIPGLIKKLTDDTRLDRKKNGSFSLDWEMFKDKYKLPTFTFSAKEDGRVFVWYTRVMAFKYTKDATLIQRITSETKYYDKDGNELKGSTKQFQVEGFFVRDDGTTSDDFHTHKQWIDPAANDDKIVITRTYEIGEGTFDGKGLDDKKKFTIYLDWGPDDGTKEIKWSGKVTKYTETLTVTDLHGTPRANLETTR
jgi:RHS repeat-associated protein